MGPSAAVAVALTLLANLPETGAEGNQIEQLRWIEKANPTADVEAALKKNDHTLLAVHGNTWVIPGTDEPKKSEYKARYGVRVIQGTDDQVINKERLRLIRLATGYAANYNCHLLKRLGVQSNVL